MMICFRNLSSSNRNSKYSLLGPYLRIDYFLVQDYNNRGTYLTLTDEFQKTQLVSSYSITVTSRYNAQL